MSDSKEKPEVFGLKHKHRQYQCSQCGHQQTVGTNHTASCSDICGECSWKPSQGDGHKIPSLGGHTYRLFKYVGHLSEDEMLDLSRTRPHFPLPEASND